VAGVPHQSSGPSGPRVPTTENECLQLAMDLTILGLNGTAVAASRDQYLWLTPCMDPAQSNRNLITLTTLGGRDQKYEIRR
jgi:hypothetical protein